MHKWVLPIAEKWRQFIFIINNNECKCETAEDNINSSAWHITSIRLKCNKLFFQWAQFFLYNSFVSDTSVTFNFLANTFIDNLGLFVRKINRTFHFSRIIWMYKYSDVLYFFVRLLICLFTFVTLECLHNEFAVGEPPFSIREVIMNGPHYLWIQQREIHKEKRMNLFDIHHRFWVEWVRVCRSAKSIDNLIVSAEKDNISQWCDISITTGANKLLISRLNVTQSNMWVSQ